MAYVIFGDKQLNGTILASNIGNLDFGSFKEMVGTDNSVVMNDLPSPPQPSSPSETFITYVDPVKKIYIYEPTTYIMPLTMEEEIALLKSQLRTTGEMVDGLLMAKLKTEGAII